VIQGFILIFNCDHSFRNVLVETSIVVRSRRASSSCKEIGDGRARPSGILAHPLLALSLDRPSPLLLYQWSGKRETALELHLLPISRRHHPNQHESHADGYRQKGDVRQHEGEREFEKGDVHP
jgi:hypothetical protein